MHDHATILFLETLGGGAFREHKLSVERESQILTEAQQVGTLSVGDVNPLPGAGWLVPGSRTPALGSSARRRSAG